MFRDVLTNSLTAPFRRVRGLMSGNAAAAADQSETIWALKDVSFDVRKGDVVGIIGRNGSGKSTLLKVLSRITDPTEGRAEIYGRVGALLEVGTGFHPELTGRENITLNGAILGMSRHEIRRKFDEIVAFAEVEKFIDTPVKHYSSGMGLRLGFAVAAHLEPEILIVDEVLAVGDAAFQKKCLGKMGEVAGEGRTVLFVSHNMAAMREICQRGVLLANGSVVYDGDIASAIQTYQFQFKRWEEEAPSTDVWLGNIRVNGGTDGSVDLAQPFEVEVTLESRKELGPFRLFCIIEDADNRILVHTDDDYQDQPQLAQPGRHQIRVRFPSLWLAPGMYVVHFKVTPVGPGLKRRYLSDRFIITGSNSVEVNSYHGLIRPAYTLEAREVVRSSEQ
jgi:lipopolysaccharide transport system ATP-binding protein